MFQGTWLPLDNKERACKTQAKAIDLEITHLCPGLGRKRWNCNMLWKTIDNKLWLNSMRNKWTAFASSLTAEGIVSSLLVEVKEHHLHACDECKWMPHELSMKTLRSDKHLSISASSNELVTCDTGKSSLSRVSVRTKIIWIARQRGMQMHPNATNMIMQRNGHARFQMKLGIMVCIFFWFSCSLLTLLITLLQVRQWRNNSFALKQKKSFASLNVSFQNACSTAVIVPTLFANLQKEPQTRQSTQTEKKHCPEDTLELGCCSQGVRTRHAKQVQGRRNGHSLLHEQVLWQLALWRKTALVPRGTRRTGAARKTGNEKEGRAVTTATVPEASAVAKPAMMFNGMNSWSFLFSCESHWLPFHRHFRSCTDEKTHSLQGSSGVICRKSLASRGHCEIACSLSQKAFLSKWKIGLISDDAKTCNHNGLQKSTEDTNAFPLSVCLGFIAKNLTAICSPLDQSTVENTKKETRTRCKKETCNGDCKTGPAFEVTRNKVVETTVQSFEQINNDNASNPCMRRAFDHCGLNPHLDNTDAFEKHLATLTENETHRRLMDKNHDRNVNGLTDTP